MASLAVEKIVLHRFKQYRDKTISPPKGFCLLAGTNNSGKSSFMQAFALWEYCKSVIEYEYGRGGLYMENIGKKQGVGINGEDFLPLNLPSLKHLWTNLRVSAEKDDKGNKEADGYTLWIEIRWKNHSFDESRNLRFSLSLANERVFVKTTNSNITENEELPKIAYIPPFAGILNREPFHTKAMRARLVGQGLSGSVMRNTLLDLYKENQRKRVNLKGDLDRIPRKDLKELRENDQWEHLQDIVRNMFGIELNVHDFNEDYHSFIKVDYWKGRYNEARTNFIKHTGFNKRDIMVEGSGFLQLLNVISLALDPLYHVIFLDEPDAHLHPTLQFSLLEELERLARKYNKQILFATHSTELIASVPPEKIMKFKNGKVKVLKDEGQKTRLITGLGSDYTPTLHKLQKTKKVLFVENESDFILLNIFAVKLKTPISDDVVVWPWPGQHGERGKLFSQLKQQIPDLKGLSIRDRDGQNFQTVTSTLKDMNNNGWEEQGLSARTWRFRYIETYLLLPSAIARAANTTKEKVVQDARDFGLELTDFSGASIPISLQELPSKPVLVEGSGNLTKKYNITKYDIANAINMKEVHKDIESLISEINEI